MPPCAAALGDAILSGGYVKQRLAYENIRKAYASI